MIASNRITIRRVIRRVFFKLAYGSFFINSNFRIRLLRLAGVDIGDECFIGQFVFFDDMYPEAIHVGSGTFITSGTKILAHFFNTEDRKFYTGEVKIGKDVFIGMNSIIIKPVSIGDGSIIGAGSVIAKDIPSSVLASGNPCEVKKEIIAQKNN